MTTSVSVPGVEPVFDAPGDLDLLRPWFDLVRRLRMKHPNGYCSVVTACVLVDQYNRPVHWMVSPRQKLEPMGGTEELEKLIAALTVGGQGDGRKD